MNSTSQVSTFNIGKGLEASAFIVNKRESLEKVTKITQKMIEMGQLISRLTIQKSSQALKVFSGRLRDTIDVFEAINIIERVEELCRRNHEGRSFFQVNTWQKITDRLFLTAHSTFKTTGFLASMGLITLGKVGAVCIGHLPVFKLVTEVLVVASSFFGIWDNTNKVTKSKHNLKLLSQKIEKWEHRSDYLERIRAGDKVEITKLEQKYEKKSAVALEEMQVLNKKLQKINFYIAALENPDTPVEAPLAQKLKTRNATELLSAYAEKAHVISGKVALLALQQKKFDERLVDISSSEYQALADKLAVKDISYKIIVLENEKENASLALTKSWLGVAKGIFKIAVVTLALFLIALNAWAAPCLLTLLGLSIIHDALGLTKILHDQYVKPKRLPLKPEISAAVVA